MKYDLICGLEIHAELKTNSKMFCGCVNDPFHAPGPNTYTCPVCLGMPGALPVANKKAIEWTIMLGLALNCKINLFSKFDRKHYFYPDLPKGYQISQYDLPFCYDGYLETSKGKVGINRIHLEEDTGKLLHKTINGKKVSLIDFNRSSVPLVEIVSEADISSAAQAAEYAKEIRRILRYLDIADCDMQKGGMRLEANTSLSEHKREAVLSGKKPFPKYKVEVKNINSFKFMEQAVAYEMDRQEKLLEKGETPKQETRGFNSNKKSTFSQRSKESAEDYRYFPDPDLPPLRFTKAKIEAIRKEIPELPAAKITRWEKEFGVEQRYGNQLLTDKERAEWLDELFAAANAKKVDSNKLASAIVNKKVTVKDYTGSNIGEVLMNFAAATATESVDEKELGVIIQKTMEENPDAVEKYKAGQKQVMGFFMGQVMRKLGKKVDAGIVSKEIAAALSK